MFAMQRSNVELKEKKLTTVLLADDHPIVMTGFSASLAKFGIKVVGEANTVEEAVEKYAALTPDVLVLDIRFGEKQTGLDTAKEILQQHPDANIVFLSQFDQDSLIKETYRIGARAFVTKDCAPAELAQAVMRAREGELYFLPQIAERLANLSVRGDSSPQSRLDERELEVFILLAKGLTIAEMVENLSLSQKTISNAIYAIKQKLGIHRPADITRLAVKHCLIEP
jgi:two-component system invasion response regulator UvrY